jgi:BirA family transcriptional regulator, biotin operon repressor / biotin---[acetyl-CoA-carboxylase] ligase
VGRGAGNVGPLFRPPAAARRARGGAAVARGLAAAEAVEDVAGVTARIKWPNDVLVDGRKVAGVLAEKRGDAVVLGIGINVNQTEAELPPDARVPAASLRVAAGRAVDREAVLGALLARRDARYEEWLSGGLSAVHADLSARDFLRGRQVTVGEVEGLAGGIDAEGRLLVDGRPVESGEVRFGG